MECRRFRDDFCDFRGILNALILHEDSTDDEFFDAVCLDEAGDEVASCWDVELIVTEIESVDLLVLLNKPTDVGYLTFFKIALREVQFLHEPRFTDRCEPLTLKGVTVEDQTVECRVVIDLRHEQLQSFVVELVIAEVEHAESLVSTQRIPDLLQERVIDSTVL